LNTQKKAHQAERDTIRGGGLMKIKQLEWIEDGQGDFTASGFFGTFQVVEIDGRYEGSLNDSNDYDGFETEDFATVNEAKGYCQTLLEKQVNDALSFVDFNTDHNENDEFEYIRKTYDLPFLRKGLRVCFDGKMGTVVSADHHVKVKFDLYAYITSCHPCWDIAYYDEKGNLLADFTGAER